MSGEPAYAHHEGDDDDDADVFEQVDDSDSNKDDNDDDDNEENDDSHIVELINTNTMRSMRKERAIDTNPSPLASPVVSPKAAAATSATSGKASEKRSKSKSNSGKSKESIMDKLERMKRGKPAAGGGASTKVELDESVEQRNLWLELDVQLFSDPARMAEGVVLSDPLEDFGKVVFSLANIPVGVGFQTERGTSVVRVSDDEVVLNGRRAIAVPRDEVDRHREQRETIAARKRAEDEAERTERAQLLAQIAERIDFRASVAESKKSKRFIPGYRVLVESRRDGSTRTVSKRFDDFLTFHRRLQNRLSLAQQTKLPKFPRRQRLVAGADAIEARRVALDHYLDELQQCDIVLAFEHELREFVTQDGEAWRAATGDDSDSSDDAKSPRAKSPRAKPAPAATAAAAAAVSTNADEYLSHSEDEADADAAPVVRDLRKTKRKSTREKVKDRLTRIASKSATSTPPAEEPAERSTAAAAAAAAAEHGDEAAADDNDGAESSGDEGAAPRKPKVLFGSRAVRKQRKQAATFGHVYVEVRDATGLPPKTQAYVALGVVDVDAALGLPAVLSSSAPGSTAVRLSAVSLEQQEAHPPPSLTKMRALSTTIGKLEPDGVAFACEWRESFRLNATEPEGQVLVISLCAKQLLKDSRLASVALPLRGSERGWWLARVDDAEQSASGATKIDGTERWIPMAFPGAPEARVRVVVAYRDAVEFSAPREFRHEGHIGFGEDGAFDVRNLPVAWKGFFKSIGIKPRELQDPTTAKMVFNIIAKHKTARSAGEDVTADQLLVDIDFAEARPSGAAPTPSAALLQDFDPFELLMPMNVADVDMEDAHDEPDGEVVDDVDEEDDDEDEDEAVEDEVPAVVVAEAPADAPVVTDVPAADSEPAAVEPAAAEPVAEPTAEPEGADATPPPPPPPPPSVADASATSTKPSKKKKKKATLRAKATPSARDVTLDSIRKGNLKAGLKSAAARELAPKPDGAGPSQLGDILKVAMSRRRTALKVDKSAPSADGVLADSALATDNDDDDDWDV